MRTTSVKDVSTVMNAFTAGLAKNAAVSGGDFKSVWDNQAGANESVEDKAPETKTTNHQEEALKAKETVRKEPKEVEKPDVNKPEDDVKNAEEAMEVLGSASNEMMQRVADAFGMSMEELKALMEELNMSEMDMLNPDKLSMLLLQAAGAEDTLALLTNESLYADYMSLMQEQQNLLAQVAGEMQISPEQLAELISEMDEVMSAIDEPVIEVSVDGDGITDVQQNTENANEMVQKAETKAETGDKGQASENQTGNLLLQNLKADMAQAASQTSQNTAVWDVDTQNIMRQIMDYMKIQVKPDVSDLEMQLHPANLGSLRIHVSAQGGAVTANFVTENEAVKAALESQMIQLKESFAEQGVKVDAIEVTVQTHAFERNLDQGRGSNQGDNDTEKKSRTRRINLNALDGMEDIEEMPQEDVLAAEMMTANGNTVDFTA